MNVIQSVMPEITFGGRKKAMRAKVLHLERKIAEQPQVDCPVKHYFAPGIYAREMTIPAGVVLTGAVHKTEHLCIISKGRISVSTDEGVREFAAPCTFVSKAGAKRAGYAHEETVWTTIHATDETDLDKLCEELTDMTADKLIGGKNNAQLLLSGRAKEES